MCPCFCQRGLPKVTVENCLADHVIYGIEAEEFGDRDSLHILMDRAADGAPFLRSYVRRRVSAGFRIQALSADTSSIDALREPLL